MQTFNQFLEQVVKLGCSLWGLVNEDCVREAGTRFVLLKAEPGVYKVDDWRLVSLRDKAKLGWRIKENNIICSLDDIYLVQEIEVGGEDGGNCWGGRPEKYGNPAATQAPFAALDSVLLATCPTLLYSEFLAIKKDGIIEEIEYTEEGYYGNSKDLVYRVVKLRKLYDWLSKR